MKRMHILTVALAAVFCMLLTGCNSSAAAPAPSTAPATEAQLQETAAPTEPSETAAPTEETTALTEETVPATEEAPAPTETPSADVEVILPPPEAEGELPEERFTLTFLGDCTIGSQPIQMNVMYSILWFIGEDYTYPFKGVIDYIDDDDLTVINLEGTFCDPMPNSGALFTFRAPY